VNQFLSGAIVAGHLVAALLFARFWRDTRDRLFAAFALAFGVLALQRLALALLGAREHAVLPTQALQALGQHLEEPRIGVQDGDAQWRAAGGGSRAS